MLRQMTGPPDPPTPKGVTWVDPGRALVDPALAPRQARRVVEHARTIQFDQPLPNKLHGALADALADHPDVGLYVYGHYGLDIDQTLSFLQGYEAVEELGVNLNGLRSLEGLQRFARVKRLSVVRSGIRFRLDPLLAMPDLEELIIEAPAKGDTVLGQIPKLKQLGMSAAKGALAPLVGHARLERLSLHYGTERDLTTLATLPALRDLSIWQIQKLSVDHLQPVGRIARLEALRLGALRHVDSLAFLEVAAAHLRYLELEQLTVLETLQPLAKFRELRAIVMFDSKPADRSLAPLRSLPALEDIMVGDVYPAGEVEGLVSGHPDAWIGVRDAEYGRGRSRAGWRGLFSYVDERRAAGH